MQHPRLYKYNGEHPRRLGTRHWYCSIIWISHCIIKYQYDYKRNTSICMLDNTHCLIQNKADYICSFMITTLSHQTQFELNDYWRHYRMTKMHGKYEPGIEILSITELWTVTDRLHKNAQYMETRNLGLFFLVLWGEVRFLFNKRFCQVENHISYLLISSSPGHCPSTFSPPVRLFWFIFFPLSVLVLAIYNHYAFFIFFFLSFQLGCVSNPFATLNRFF